MLCAQDVMTLSTCPHTDKLPDTVTPRILIELTRLISGNGGGSCMLRFRCKIFHVKISDNASFFLQLFVFVHVPPIFSVLLTYSLKVNSLLFWPTLYTDDLAKLLESHDITAKLFTQKLTVWKMACFCNICPCFYSSVGQSVAALDISQ